MVFDVFGKKARAAAATLASFAGYSLWEANNTPTHAEGVSSKINQNLCSIDPNKSIIDQLALIRDFNPNNLTDKEMDKLYDEYYSKCAPDQAPISRQAWHEKIHLELSAGVGTGVITMPGKDGVMGVGVNLTAFVPVEITDGVKVGPRADLRASGTLSTQSDTPNQGWTTDVDYTGQASVGIGGQVAVDLDEQTTAYAFLQKTWGEAGAFGRTAEHSSGLKVDLKDYTSSTEGLAAGAGLQFNGQQGEHQAVEFTYQRNEHEFLKKHGAEDKTDQSVMVTFKTGIGGPSKADDDGPSIK